MSWFRELLLKFAPLGVVSVVLFAGSLILMPWLIARLPSDYLLRKPAPPKRSTLLSLSVHALRAVVGTSLILAGIAMLFLPGQGLLTILTGLFVLEFRGKRRIILTLLRQPRLIGAVNWIRVRRGQNPLEVPSE